MSEAYESVHRAVAFSLAAILASVFLTVLVIRRIMGSYTDALVSFTSHVKDIASKEGGERLFPAESHDEIGYLARTFNSMILDHDTKSEELKYISNHDVL